MEDTNTFNEYRQVTLPYQRGSNNLVRSTQMGAQQPLMQQQVPPIRGQQRQTPAKMPKAKALSLLRKLKQGIVVASIVSFGGFGALVASHTVGTTSQTSTSSTTTTTKSATSTSTPSSTSTSTSTPSSTSTTTPSSTSTSTSSSSQQGGSNGFGSSNTASNPVSGTHTS